MSICWIYAKGCRAVAGTESRIPREVILRPYSLVTTLEASEHGGEWSVSKYRHLWSSPKLGKDQIGQIKPSILVPALRSFPPADMRSLGGEVGGKQLLAHPWPNPHAFNTNDPSVEAEVNFLPWAEQWGRKDGACGSCVYSYWEHRPFLILIHLNKVNTDVHYEANKKNLFY